MLRANMIYGHPLLGAGQALLLAVLIASATPLFSQARTPVPAEADQAEAFGLVKEIFGQEWDSAKTTARKQALATKLLAKAGESVDDANRYVLLKIARDIAAGAGDADLALQAVDAMAARYDVDAYRLKGAALAQTARSSTLQKQWHAVAEHALVLAGQAVARDDFVAAKYLGSLALEGARKGRDGQLAKRATTRSGEIEEIAKAYAATEGALATLQASPEDPQANLAVGKYYCFFKGDWDRGLRPLASGSDEHLKKLAAGEQGDVSTADAQVAMGNGWWDLASASEGVVKEQLLRRAAYWYRRALPGLKGLEKDRVAKRLAGAPEAVAFVPPSAPKEHVPQPAPNEQWIQLFNGEDLRGWSSKFTGQALGENFANTFRVENGVLKVKYDQYRQFGDRFGHLFYRQPFSKYVLRLEYRFVGRQCPGGPKWAVRNSGVVLHTQSPQSMRMDQDFPVGLVVQLVGGTGSGNRPTANVCTPGMRIFMGGKPVTSHCTESRSKTYHGDQWVTLEIEVHGHGTIRHHLDGEVVLEYQRPELDEADADARRLIQGGAKAIHGGFIALQAQSQPIEFRRIEVRKLD